MKIRTVATRLEKSQWNKASNAVSGKAFYLPDECTAGKFFGVCRSVVESTEHKLPLLPPARQP